MSDSPSFSRYGAPGGVLLRFVEGPLDAGRLAAVDELLATCFRLGRQLDELVELDRLHEQAQTALGEAGPALLGADLFRDVSCWLGDGPCEDGSVLEALAGLHNEGVVNLGLPLRRQCTAAGWIITRIGADGPTWLQRRAARG